MFQKKEDIIEYTSNELLGLRLNLSHTHTKVTLEDDNRRIEEKKC